MTYISLKAKEDALPIKRACLLTMKVENMLPFLSQCKHGSVVVGICTVHCLPYQKKNLLASQANMSDRKGHSSTSVAKLSLKI